MAPNIDRPSTFQTNAGGKLDLTEDRFLIHSHVLQRYRDVWQVIREYPFLLIDKEKVDFHASETTAFPVFVFGSLLQNVSREELAQRMVTSIVSPSIIAGFTAASGVVVEGEANPRSRILQTHNDPLDVGMYPYAAMGIRYIYVENDHLYQHKIGDLVAVDNRSRPHSALVNFDRLADLQNALFDTYFMMPGNRLSNTRDLERHLDEIFI
jgi:hypothetical protein